MYPALKTASKNIRAELKAAYPWTKFSVRAKQYTGGNSITIDWTNGPEIEAVKTMTNKYKAGWFDAMTDCYEHTKGRDESLGETYYIFLDRTV